jgi:glycerophosphoryl diester phosphodiesterase
MVALIELGVDGFVTDEPALAQAVFDARTSLAA